MPSNWANMPAFIQLVYRILDSTVPSNVLPHRLNYYRTMFRVSKISKTNPSENFHGHLSLDFQTASIIILKVLMLMLRKSETSSADRIVALCAAWFRCSCKLFRVAASAVMVCWSGLAIFKMGSIRKPLNLNCLANINKIIAHARRPSMALFRLVKILPERMLRERLLNL